MAGEVWVLAHPVTDAAQLPFAPVVILAVTATLVTVVALTGRTSGGAARPLRRTSTAPLTGGEWIGRGVVLALLAAALLAGQFGTNAPARNLASFLLVAAGVPLLTLGSLLLGPFWGRVDPADSLARLVRAPDGLRRPPDDPAVAHVWPALPLAALIAGYLAVHPLALAPRTLSTVVATYLIVTLAGCLALGRRRWLEQVEPVGLLLTWFGGLRGRRLVAWSPPAGAGALLGAVAGVLLFGVIRGSSRYVELAFTFGLRATDVLGALVAAGVGAALVGGCARRWDAGTATAAAVPVVAAIVLVFSLREGRALVALDLLPGVLVDPLGRGWTLAGIEAFGPRTLPITAEVLLVVQLALLVLGALAAARVVRLRTAGTVTPVGAGVLVIVGLAALALAAITAT